MIRTFAYIRVSTSRQELSPDVQQERITHYVEYKGLPALEDRIFIDSASARSKRFLERPAARKLDSYLERDDHIVIYRLDRGFRNTRDCLGMVDSWNYRGIQSHILDLN